MNRALTGLVISAAFLSGCARTLSDEGMRPSTEYEDRIGNGIVFDERQLADARMDLLDVISTRIPNAQVVRVDGCNTVQLRGRKSLLAPVPPGVYIDGHHTSSSCVLGSLSTVDISRVEVYPGGVTQRRGYFTSAGGLILVFLKNGGEL